MATDVGPLVIKLEGLEEMLDALDRAQPGLVGLILPKGTEVTFLEYTPGPSIDAGEEQEREE